MTKIVAHDVSGVIDPNRFYVEVHRLKTPYKDLVIGVECKGVDTLAALSMTKANALALVDALLDIVSTLNDEAKQ